jgi:hypothetical protein
MKLSEKILIVASWLEDSQNDLLVNAESNESCLTMVAGALVIAADALKDCAEEIVKIEPQNALSAESLDEMAALAQAFDESDDDLLKKQASVLDEILFTLGAPKNAINVHKKAEDDRIEQLKKKYKDTKAIQEEFNKISDSVKAIEKSPYYKEYRPLEAPLSSRYCPEHPGSQIARIGEHTWICSLDKKVYNYDTGFTTMQGNKVPGGDVSLQTPMQYEQGRLVFENRDQRLGIQRK